MQFHLQEHVNITNSVTFWINQFKSENKENGAKSFLHWKSQNLSEIMLLNRDLNLSEMQE